ncbi:MAG TPA: M67 family metallopeptidase [Nitrospiraceae bacterium]|jgi:proteasome lid subunit RPN8/RPN11|nr:M67 family metallopeptidase [Nitrospiraceae bacterium]
MPDWKPLEVPVATSDLPDLSIPQQILDQIVAHARELAPYECCGLLAGRAGRVTDIYRIANVVALEGASQLASFDDAKISHLERLSPQERAEIAFVMDARDLALAQKDMRKRGLELQVVYHSHPHDPARPSVTDVKIATDYEEYWGKINLPVPAYSIVSLMDQEKPDLRTYWIKNGTVTSAVVRIL